MNFLGLKFGKESVPTPTPAATTSEQAVVNNAAVSPDDAMIAVPGLSETPATIETTPVAATVAPNLADVAISAPAEVAPEAPAGDVVETPTTELPATGNFAIPEVPADAFTSAPETPVAAFPAIESAPETPEVAGAPIQEPEVPAPVETPAPFPSVDNQEQSQQ